MLEMLLELGSVAYVFNPSAREAEAGEEASLVYRASYRTVKATQRNHVLKTNKEIPLEYP